MGSVHVPIDCARVVGIAAAGPVEPFPLDFLAPLYQLAGDDLEDLVDAGIVASRDLVAGVHAGPAEAFVVAQVLGSIGHTSLERDFALRRVGVDQVGLGADDMDDDIVVDVFLEFDQPLEMFCR